LLGPGDRRLVTRTDEQGRTTVLGGDGLRGARFPTGIENLVAEYRSGQGADGNVEADKIIHLATRPPGVQKVTNPLPATGGADPDDIESTRTRAPLAVRALDRLVSVEDYQDFALRFAGIAKASARLDVGSGVYARWRVRTTVAGVEPLELEPNCELIARLYQAMRRFGDPSLGLEVIPARLDCPLIQARVAIAPGYVFREVAPRLRATLVEQLGYSRQAIGHPIHPSRVLAIMHRVEGVHFVDLDIPTLDVPTLDVPPSTNDPDTVLHVDPTQPERLVLEEWTA
jgi:predicted phage baseplate assembly protein